MKLNKNVTIRFKTGCSDVEFNAFKGVAEKYNNGTLYVFNDHIKGLTEIRFRCSKFKYNRCMSDINALRKVR